MVKTSPSRHPAKLLHCLLALLLLSLGAFALAQPLTIAAAGDIACAPDSADFNGGAGTPDHCQMRATSDLILKMKPQAVLALGDEQYDAGQYENFLRSYDLTWGRFKDITHPVPGNHEYYSKGAAGYYRYFGSAAGDPDKGYYSFDLGAWHFIALNSSCDAVGGCGTGSPQERWLKADLAAHPGRCILAYWHEPRFSSGFHGLIQRFRAFWDDLYAAGADLVLNGHDHDYERFAPQDPSGRADPHGIREFVVGTGGESHYPFIFPRANSEVRNSHVFGVLFLTLHPDGYSWKFTSTQGDFSDSGSGVCHHGL